MLTPWYAILGFSTAHIFYETMISSQFLFGTRNPLKTVVDVFSCSKIRDETGIKEGNRNRKYKASMRSTGHRIAVDVSLLFETGTLI